MIWFQSDQRLTLDIGGQVTPGQKSLHQFRQSPSPTRGTDTHLPLDLRAPKIQLEMQRLSLVGSDRLVIHAPAHTPGDVADYLADHLVGNSSSNSGDGLRHESIQLLGNQSHPFEPRQIDHPAGERHRPALRDPRFQIDQQPGLPFHLLLGLVLQFPPGIGADVVQRTAVPDPRPYLMLHVVMAEGDVAPVLPSQLIGLQRRASEVDRRAIDGEHPLDFAVQHQQVSLRPSGRAPDGPNRPGPRGHGQHWSHWCSDGARPRPPLRPPRLNS